MNHPIFTFIWLAWPIITALLVLILQFGIKKSENDESKVQFSIFGLVSFERSIRKIWLVRTFLLVVGVVLLSVPAFRDYADYFPTHMQLEVFFDNEGINTALTEYTPSELEDLKIKNNWQADKAEYLSKLNAVLETRVKIPFRFDVEKGIVHGKGDTYFEAVQIRRWGIQRYLIKRATGTLTHSYEAPGQNPQTLNSTFELLDTENNYIELSIIDIYFRHTKILKPRFKQLFKMSPTETIYDHNLTAVTKLRFFPYIDIGRTIYLIQHPSGKYVPIGYAIYTPD